LICFFEIYAVYLEMRYEIMNFLDTCQPNIFCYYSIYKLVKVSISLVSR
jgi:hypothetical protein